MKRRGNENYQITSIDLGNSAIAQKHNNIHIIEVSEKEKWEKVAERLFEQIIAENFSNLGKEKGIQVQGIENSPQN